MRFLIQMGYGMMGMNLELLANFGDGRQSGVIISPRTLTLDQIESHARDILSLGATLLYDSCFYSPDTNRSKIVGLPYWDGFNSNSDWAGEDGVDFCRRVIQYQVDTLKVTEVLLPGSYTNVCNDGWLSMHYNFAQVGHDMGVDIPVYATIAIGPDLIRNATLFDTILNEIVSYPVDGIYFLYRPPEDGFLCKNDLFLTNLLCAFLSLSLAGKKIILGYANQQDLVFAAAGVGTIATGNYRNVRSFNPDIFYEQEPADSRRRKWYFDGQSLCEFRCEQLEVAYQKFGMKGLFGPATKYSQDMLLSPYPNDIIWPESSAFKHFITVLRNQWLSFAETEKRLRHGTVELLLRMADQRITEYQKHKLPLLDRAGQTVAAIPAWTNALQSFIQLESLRLVDL